MRSLMLRISLALVMATSIALAAAGGAQAVVVDMQASGSSVPFNPQSQAGYAGVALLPGTPASTLSAANIPVVTSTGPCADLALTSDFGNSLPDNALCWHGGNVVHANETFALTWDPDRRYWEGTRDYVEQFLSNVAAGSGEFTSPYAVSAQYTDRTGRAANHSLYGGGCVDFGNPGGYTCQFGNPGGSGIGNNYPANGCTVSGTNPLYEFPDYSYGPAPNDICLTDAQIQQELAGGGSWAGLIPSTGLRNRVKSGYSPLVVVLMPPGVEVCLDSTGLLCSANGASAAQFCSYHSQVNVGGTEIPYVVVPWAPLTACDEPDIPQITFPVQANVIAAAVGKRLVSPLSQGQLAAITDPGLNAWFALDGAEINDNGCIPLPKGVDAATINGTAYLLRHEFNNGGTLVNDPNSPECAPLVNLQPTFVAPSAVDRGDEIQLDGSTTNSTLIVPKQGYYWTFGDGSSAYGPSVVHAYTAGGTYDVTLTVIDRGGDVAKLTQTITVIGPTQVPPSRNHGNALKARLQLMPESRKGVLGSGISMRVTVNESAAGFISISIPRNEARKAHIAGRGSSVVIGRGTVSRLKHGTAALRLKMARGVAGKLKRLRHVTLTVRLQLVGTAGDHLAIDVAGRY
jgi:hypothetical protein